MRDAGVNIFCPAKLNVALSVGGADAARGGMHPIASWMVALRFGDRMTVKHTAGGASRFDIQFVNEAAGREVDWPIETDLTYRARALLGEHVGRDLPVDMSVRKCIGPGAGLGGGSSNAAGALVAMNRLFELGLGEATLLELGGRLGSDVPFLVAALLGRPWAVVSGLGDVIEPAAPAEVLHVVLVMPPFGCNTAAVYRAFDELAGSAGEPKVQAVHSLSRQRVLTPDAPFNDLAAAACHVEPRLAALRRRVERAAGRAVHVTGSGSAMFVVAADEGDAAVAAKRIRDEANVTAVATRTL